MEIIIGILVGALWVFFLLGIFTKSKDKEMVKPKRLYPERP